MTLSGKRVKDRRIQKTQNLLKEALDSLIREKSYDAIAVREILERANVGRSTFYTHFQDKDALLASCMHDMLHSVRSPPPLSVAKRPEDLVRFSLPIFEHIHEHRRTARGGMDTRARVIIHEHLRSVLAELIVGDVRKAYNGRCEAAGQIPHDLLVQYITSTFIVVLNWWVDSKSSLRPKEVNDLFGALIRPTLGRILP